MLDLVLLLQIDRDDPLWLICLAIGQLQVLVQDAPLEWQNLFEAFQEELTAWTNTHLNTLEAIARQAATAERLATSANELTTSLTALTRILSEQTASSMTSTQNYESLRGALTDLREAMSHRLDKIELSSQNRQTPTLNPVISTNGTFKLSLLIVFGAVAFGMYTLWQGQQANAQRLEWVLIKLTRQECLVRIKPANSPECKRL